MRNIRIFDTTLRDGEQSPGCTMNISEKLEIAKRLEALNVDVIEAGFASSSAGDFESVRAIADIVKNSEIASLSRAVISDIDCSWDAIKSAQKPCIHIFMATSPIHMQYKLKMSEREVLSRIEESVKHAKKLCDLIEFSAEDASRSDPAFLAEAYNIAIKSGATCVNLPDTVGYSTPTEMYNLTKYIKENVLGIDNVVLSVHCHNDLGLAVANSLGALAAGANQVECTVNGIGERAGNASLEEIAMIIKTRRDFYNIDTRIDTYKINSICQLVSSITGLAIPPTKPIVGGNVFLHEAGIHQHGVMANRSTYEILKPDDIGLSESRLVLGKHSGRHAFSERISELGFNLSSAELDNVFEHFKALADRKKEIFDKDIIAILNNQSFEMADGYKLSRFVVNSGSNIASTASVKLVKEGIEYEDVCCGDGPINAAFKVIDRIVAKDFRLDDYYIRSVSEGGDAMGEVTVKLKSDGKIFTGRGISTDIVEASIKAYINGINKLL